MGLSLGYIELMDHLLFAYIEPSHPRVEVSTFICSALRLVEPLLPLDPLPSMPRGAMLLRCDFLANREILRLHRFIAYDEHELFL